LQPVEAFRLPIPRVSDSERIEIDSLGDAHDGVIHVTARFGYMETPDIRRALHVLEPEKTDGLIAIDDTRRISCRRSN
jgi:KUP system potassium uptake protein